MIENVDINFCNRPPKLVFLVSTEKEAIKAIRYNTIAWGGIYNEIYHKDEIYNPKLNDLSDYIVDLTYGTKQNTYFYQIDFDSLKTTQGGQPVSFFVDMLPIFYEIKKKNLNCVSPPNESNLIEIFRMGEFSEDYYIDFKEAYSKICEPLQNDLNPLRSPFLESTPYSPIELTGFDLKIKRPVWDKERNYVFLIGNLNNLKDVLYAWNLRAIGKLVTFLDASKSMKNLGKEISEIIEEIDHCHKQDRSSNHDRLIKYNFTYRSREYNEIAKKLSKKFKYYIMEPQFFFNVPEIISDYFPQTESMSIIGFLSNNTLSFKPPIKNYLLKVESIAKVGFLVKTPISNRLDENSIMHSIPDLYKKEELFSFSEKLEMRIHGNSITEFNYMFEKTSLVIMLSPIEFWSRHFLYNKNLNLKLSSPGHNMASILDANNGIEGCRILKIEAVRQLILLLQKDKSLNKQKIWQQIINPYFSENNLDYLFHKVEKSNFINILCNKGLIRQGYQLKCKKCMNKSWYSLSDITDTWKCRFCLNVTRTPFLSEEKLFFKLNGLYQIEGGVRGALTNILVLWFFKHIDSFINLNYVLSFELKDKVSQQINVECDLLITMPAKSSEETDIIIVESKSSNELKQKDIEQMKKIEKLIGQESYKCFATLKDHFSENEQVKLKKIYEKSKKIILLTSQELSPFKHWDCFPNYRGKYILGTADLATATVQKYLGLENI